MTFSGLGGNAEEDVDEEDLPEGAAFSAVIQETKDKLPACKLRVSQKSAADQIWEDYGNGKLRAILKEKLLHGIGADNNHLKMSIHIMEEEYEWACKTLAGSNSTELSDETQKMKKVRIPPVFLDKSASRKLELRSYQQELSIPALKGNNCIICAPTNSGKTYVALAIAIAHLAELKAKAAENKCRTPASTSIPRKKVLFIVNKVNLVLQQRQRFDYYLSNRVDGHDVTDISGANAQDKQLDEITEENDVIVLTAQILVDALKSRRVSITDYSLLIFDECHHTDKGHPYNDIMLKYLGIKYGSRGGQELTQERQNLPQIIGLTASLGVGKAKSRIEAQDHILQLCSNLDCSAIVTVEKHKKDLQGFTGRCIRTCHEIANGETDYFDEIMNAVMVNIEQMLPRLSRRNGTPNDRGGQQYQQWLKELDRDSVTHKSREQCTLVQHLQVYNTALAIKKCCRVKDALKYVTEFHDRQREDKFKDIDRNLRALYQKAREDLDLKIKEKGELRNPKLEAVASLLKQKYQACVEEGGQQTAKGMLFTKTRESTKALKAWLDENPDLRFIRAERLVGTGKGEDGMTQCQQEEVIANFRSGRVNLLVSTTVGEEGIDIPDCKFVIRYDVRGNEIASVQSRGRVRDREGQYEVVAGKETGVIEKENLNVIREEMMEDAIREVKAMNVDEYKEKILDLQRRTISQRQRKETIKKYEKGKRHQEKVKLFCRKCQVFACSGISIRCIKEAHHVVIDQDFPSKFYFKKSKSPRKINDIELTGPLHCQDCDAEWGVMLKYKSKELPCIKASCFGFEFEEEDGSTKTFSFRKWKDVLFNVKGFDPSETQTEFGSLDIPELSLD